MRACPFFQERLFQPRRTEPTPLAVDRVWLPSRWPDLSLNPQKW